MSASDGRDAGARRFASFVSRPRFVVLTILAAGMTMAAAYVYTVPEPRARVAGVVGVVFFGACTLVIAYQLGAATFVREPVVVLDEDGVHDRRWPVGPVPWRDVAKLRVWEHRGNRCLCVDLVDPARHIAGLSWWRRLAVKANRRLGAGVLNISFTGLRPGLDDALAFVTSLERDA